MHSDRSACSLAHFLSALQCERCCQHFKAHVQGKRYVSTTNLRSLKPHTYASDLRRLVASMPVNSRSTRRPATLSENFFKLDSWGRAGLRESEFKKLFAKCICGLVMTTRVFQDHDCAIAVVPHTIIDLTTDNDNDSAVIYLTNDS
jgi:hypothetical protein